MCDKNIYNTTRSYVTLYSSSECSNSLHTYTAALLVLVVILLYRSYTNSGSWSPNNDSLDELPEHPVIDTMEDEFVTLASFKCVNDEFRNT